MSSRDLPARPNLDHLKNEAKALRKAFDAGDPSAVQRVHAYCGASLAHELADLTASRQCHTIQIVHPESG